MRRLPWIIGLALACGAGSEAPASESGSAAVAASAGSGDSQLGCVPAPNRPVEGRASPYDSLKFEVGGATAQVCYNRPYTKGRQIFGGLVPYGQLWRTGANEPTILHFSAPATIAGIAVGAGSYSLYTIPGETEWTVIVNRSTTQWGHESNYTPDIEAMDVGRASVPSEPLEEPVEQFTITTEAQEAGVQLILDWERTRVRIPILPG
jgi:hypothetical protein